MSGGIGGGSDEGFDLDTKGQIHGHNGTSQVAISVGTNGQVLKADSTQASGIAWEDASGGAEFNTFTTATTWNPTAQTGVTRVMVDYTAQTGGKLDLKVDGSTVATLQDSDSNKVYDRILNPSSSLSLVSAEKKFGFNSITTEGTPSLSGGSGNSDLQLFWKPDGTVLYRFRRNSGANYQAWLQQFTNNGDPFDATASFTYNGETSATVTGMDYFNGGRWLSWNSDGTKIIGFNLEQGGFTKRVRSYNLSVPYDVTTMSTTENDNYTPTQGSANAQQWACMTTNGDRLYHGNYGTVYQYNLSTPFSLSSASYSGNSKSVSAGTPYGFYVNADSSELYVHGSNSSGTIRKYAFGTAGNLSTLDTVNYTDYTGVGSASTNAYGLNWDNGLHVCFQGSTTFKYIGGAFAGTTYASVNQ